MTVLELAEPSAGNGMNAEPSTGNGMNQVTLVPVLVNCWYWDCRIGNSSRNGIQKMTLLEVPLPEMGVPFPVMVICQFWY
jgi:hypothetical protein